jgi:hypothetical protein
MRTVAVLATALASVAMFAAPASAHKVPKAYQCVPIEGNSSPAFDKTCDVWFTNGEFAGACGCDPGFTLFDPVASMLTIQDQDSSGGSHPPKASGS